MHGTGGAAHQATRVAQRVVALGERVDPPLHHVGAVLHRAHRIGERAIDLVGGFHRNGHAEMGHGRMVRRPVTIP